MSCKVQAIVMGTWNSFISMGARNNAYFM